jgi:hypothetical protein
MHTSARTQRPVSTSECVQVEKVYGLAGFIGAAQLACYGRSWQF